MSFNRTYLFYLTLIVLIPTVVTGLLTKSFWLVVAAFILFNIVARLAIPLFHYIFRLIGDRSEESKLNTAVRLILTNRNYPEALHRIFPQQDIDFLIATGKTVISQLSQLANEIDNGQIPETEARMKLKLQFPFLDKANCDWLNKGGRAYLRRKAKASSL